MRIVKAWTYRNYAISCSLGEGNYGIIAAVSPADEQGVSSNGYFRWYYTQRWPQWYWGYQSLEMAIEAARQWIDADILRRAELGERILAVTARIDTLDEMAAAQKEIEALLA